MTAIRFTAADRAYIRSSYLTLAELCASRPESPQEIEDRFQGGVLPCASYVLDDGSGMFPADYFRLVDEAGGPKALRGHFEKRHRAACIAQRMWEAQLEEDWAAYIGGVYGICLREVTPETIVRKSALVASLCQLHVLAQPRSAEWRKALRAQVDELDALEREFAPDYDRSERQQRLPTRDLLIEAAYKRFPDVFGDAR